ncbi:uncharacterized protein TRIADDRAFT_51973 [Trichoplax adhaerens]|uniref:Uncharacterized protein n=1 Tax=Trichoplax adhaerens TaxID=10228 RepID=B3RLE0_TRIAD|nr:predicted protein [Trichoplax adhaerens]EDV29526.1 predicted protein [Trichoplax adhaerens]|eukprot:XP_002108728.1 predicted protein [Trichoplax adhaerens]
MYAARSPCRSSSEEELPSHSCNKLKSIKTSESNYSSIVQFSVMLIRTFDDRSALKASTKGTSSKLDLADEGRKDLMKGRNALVLHCGQGCHSKSRHWRRCDIISYCEEYRMEPYLGHTAMNHSISRGRAAYDSREFLDYIYRKYDPRWTSNGQQHLALSEFTRLLKDAGLNQNNDTTISYSDQNLTLFRQHLILEATGHYDNITERYGYAANCREYLDSCTVALTNE